MKAAAIQGSIALDAAKQAVKAEKPPQAHLYSGPVYMHPTYPCQTCTKSPTSPLSCDDRQKCANYQIWDASRQFSEAKAADGLTQKDMDRLAGKKPQVASGSGWDHVTTATNSWTPCPDP